MLSMLFYFLKT